MTGAPADGAYNTYELLTSSDTADAERATNLPDERPTRRTAPSLADRLRALEAFSAA